MEMPHARSSRGLNTSSGGLTVVAYRQLPKGGHPLHNLGTEDTDAQESLKDATNLEAKRNKNV
ncbi:hypothetical protein LguiA_032128 [Lonicera macranthoides]